MASNSIKIFNDTVLKQSVLQGYEVQRTNNNLGQFTMGELAFTRDTGRLFVGNVTNSLKDKDSLPVTGGILTGNKYLGAIDSKPLIHFAASGQTGWKPLSYEQDIKDVTQTEYALFGQKSRFRKNDGVGGNGWDKTAQYIEKYGVYSGDYTFDVYNNALIIFDKSITTRQSEQPRRELITDKNGKKIEVIKGFDGSTLQDIQEHRRRTPLFNSAMEANSEYPIYGDGYVVMRILEPDGITIGYSDRTFKNDTTDLTDAEPKTIDNNWSHNYLTIKNVPSSTLQASFSTQFVSNVTEGLLYLNKNLTGIDSISASSGNIFTLPSEFKFGDKLSSSPSFKYNLDSKVINVSTPDDYIFTLSSNGAGSNAYSMKLSKQSNPSFTIKLKDGLINPLTGRSEITLNANNSKSGMLALGFSSSEISANTQIGNNNPFGSKVPSNYYHVGTAIFDSSGALKGTEKYDDNYKNENINLINNFESSDNCGLNLLKEPLAICWSTPIESDIDTTTSANCHFLISPYVCCIKKEYTSSVKSLKTSPSDGTSSYEIDETKWENYMSVIGNNTLASSNLKSTIGVVAGYSFDINDTSLKSQYLSQNNKTKKSCRIPLDFFVEGEKTAYDTYSVYKNSNNEIVYYLSMDDGKYFKTNSNNVLVEETKPDLENVNLSNTLYVLHESSNLDSLKFEKPYVIEKDCFENMRFQVENNDGTSDFIEGEWAPKQKYENYTVLMTLRKEENNFYAYDGPEDLILLSSHLEPGDVIKTIEISTNDLTKEWVTLFAAPKANDITDSGHGYVYYPHEKTRVVVIKDEGGQVTYQCVLNAPLFVENSYSPYCLRVNYKTRDDDGEEINATKVIKLDSVITYDIKSSSNTYKCFVNGSSQTSVNSVDLLTNGNFDIDKVISNKVDAICQYELEDYQLLVTSNDVVKKSSVTSAYTTTTQSFQLETELTSNTYEVTYRFSAIKTPIINQQYAKDFMIKEVTCTTIVRDENGETSSSTVQTFLWDSDDLTQKDKIIDLLDQGVIYIPDTFMIPYKNASFSYIAFNDVPALPNGYNIPDFVQREVVIPTHASSVLLEVHRAAPSGNSTPVTIYTAETLSSLVPTKEESSTDEETGTTTTKTVNDNTPYEFPFEINTASQLPSITSGKGMNSKMKVLYSSKESGCQIVEVPLYKSVINNYKGFIIRMDNVNCGNTDGKFLIRVIGYRV